MSKMSRLKSLGRPRLTRVLVLRRMAAKGDRLVAGALAVVVPEAAEPVRRLSLRAVAQRRLLQSRAEAQPKLAGQEPRQRRALRKRLRAKRPPAKRPLLQRKPPERTQQARRSQ